MKKLIFLTATLFLTSHVTTPADADYCINNLVAHHVTLHLYRDLNATSPLLATVKGGHPYKKLKKSDFPLYVSFCDSGDWQYPTPNKNGVVTPQCQVDVFGANNYVSVHKIDHPGCYSVNYVNVHQEGESGHMSVLKDPACACKVF